VNVDVNVDLDGGLRNTSAVHDYVYDHVHGDA